MKKLNLKPPKFSLDTTDELNKYFTKFPNRFYNAEWFFKKDHLIVFMHLLSKANWQETIKVYKDKRCIVGIGECIIVKNEFSKTLKIDNSKLNRVLKYFQSINEIEIRTTNVFTLISINYLIPVSPSESPVKHQQTTKYPKLLRLKEVIVTLDKIDDKDDRYNINKIDFVDVNHGFNLKENELKANLQESNLEIESVFKDNSKITFNDKLLQVWCEEYFSSKSIQYVIKDGKDHKGLNSLITLFKKEQADLDEHEMLEFFRKWLKKVFALNNTFINGNSSPMLFYSQINKINLLLSNSSSVIRKTNETRNYTKSLK